MKRPWTDNLQLVTVAQGETPKPVTLIYPYYDNPVFLRQQIGWWHTYPSWMARHLSAIIVDDGSPETPAAHALPVQPFPLRLFRIHQDVRWNWLAARNIGMHHAPEGWCLLTDMDHVVPETTAQAVLHGKHDPNVIYGFSRVESNGVKISPHPNSWFMTRQMFWNVGGYDETLSGLYGTDGDWRRRCATVAPIQILTDRLIRHEYEADSSTRRYLRKQPEDAKVKAIIAKRRAGWRPKVLSFAYDEIPLTVMA